MRNLHMIPWELSHLAELLDLYIYVYGPETTSSEELLAEINARLTAFPNNIYTMSNPRGAGRHSAISDVQRETVKTFRNEGKSIRQIVDATGLSNGAVHKLIHEQRP